jgi:hypothetical protein
MSEHEHFEPGIKKGPVKRCEVVNAAEKVSLRTFLDALEAAANEQK